VILRRFLIHVGQSLLEHLGILDASDDPDRPAAGRAGLDVDIEGANASSKSWPRGSLPVNVIQRNVERRPGGGGARSAIHRIQGEFFRYVNFRWTKSTGTGS